MRLLAFCISAVNLRFQLQFSPATAEREHSDWNRNSEAGLNHRFPAISLDVFSQLTPSDKVSHVMRLRESGHRVVMVGDGSTTRRSLAASESGMAMGCGADVSRESAQVCLLGNDLTRIPWSIRLARQTRRVIRQNLIWAFGYNSAGVIVACLGYLNPAVAAGLMIVSSLLVITNSLRLMAFEAPHSNENALLRDTATVNSDSPSTNGSLTLNLVTLPGFRFMNPDQMTIPLVFLSGVLGTAHCIGMCGGISATISLGASRARSAVVHQLAWSFGRIFT